MLSMRLYEPLVRAIWNMDYVNPSFMLVHVGEFVVCIYDSYIVSCDISMILL